MRVGVVSDTHGVFDERVSEALAGVDCIVHAGDIGGADVLWQFESIAPVRAAVLGNCDGDIPGYSLGALARLTIEQTRLLVIHDLHTLGPIPPDVDVVVCGHSHAPRNEWHGRVLVVNPGSASQRRRQPSRSVGVLHLAAAQTPVFEVLDLDAYGAPTHP